MPGHLECGTTQLLRSCKKRTGYRTKCCIYAIKEPDVGQSAVHMLQLISSPELVLTYPHIQARDKCNVR